MELIDTSKSILENIYLISGPIIAILGLFIINQIILAKKLLTIAKKQLEESQKQMTINSQRHAATLSADLVKKYIDEIIASEDRLYFEMKKANIPDLIKMEIKNFTNDEIVKLSKKSFESFIKRPVKIHHLELKIVNKLEAFSVYFIKGIADEKVAFSSIGKEFCKSVEEYYPHIALLRGSKNPNKSYRNLIELYKCWKERLDSFKIDFEREEISKEIEKKITKLEAMQNKAHNYHEIKPIGT